MSQMLKCAVAGVAAVVIMSAGCATEKPTVTKPKVTKATAAKSVCQKIDANKDGKLTSDEHKARLGQWFKELDANSDGKLTPDEFQGKRFTNIDVNKDGVVTVEEYVALFVGKDTAIDKTAACDKLDANGDNEVTAVEVIAYRKSVFNAIDADGCGKATPKDLKTHTDKQFKSIDADKDGFVTVNEMIAVIAIPAATPKVEEKKADQPAE